MPRFVFSGPQSTGTVMFHVHREGCRDINKSDTDFYTIEAPDAQSAVDDEIAEYHSQGMESYAREHFRIFPCCT